MSRHSGKSPLSHDDAARVLNEAVVSVQTRVNVTADVVWVSLALDGLVSQVRQAETVDCVCRAEEQPVVGDSSRPVLFPAREGATIQKIRV